MHNSQIYTHPLFENYQSRQPQWERYASIRSRPRRLLEEEKNINNFFPASRQPLVSHPKIQALRERSRQFILVQSLYKYMNDIANIEKDIINKIAYQITKDQYFIKFSNEMKQDALSIIIDESYHAYVALDFMFQVTHLTGIEPILLPNRTELSDAIYELGIELDNNTRMNFEFIAVCIAEHALTNDLIVTAKLKDVCKTFYYVMQDHVLDEGRHAKYFAIMLEIFWFFLPQEQKDIIGPLLPELLKRYFRSDLQRTFDNDVLKILDFTKEEIISILDDTHPQIPLATQKESNIIIRQMLNLLNKTGVMEHTATKNAFMQYDLIN